MNKIRCIASDMDGTLLPSGQRALEKKILHATAEAINRGLMMVAASGRPYESLKKLWEPLWNQMVFICANGTLIMENGVVLYQNPLEKKVAIAIAEDIEMQPGCEFLITCANFCYIRPKTEAYRCRIEEKMCYPVQCIQSFDDIPEAILQVSGFREDGIEKSSEQLILQWGEQVQAVVSGKLWMDFTAASANKGRALHELLRQKKVSKEHTIALGDSYNDIAMFKEAGVSFAMEWSPEKVKQEANHITAYPVQELIRLTQESY